MSLQDFKDGLGKEIFGKSASEAWEERVCVSCHKPVTSENIRSKQEAKEYQISGLCGICYDQIFSNA
jgi:hypothetical protein